MHTDHARATCRFLRWIEEMDAIIAQCASRPDDHECVLMARVMTQFRDSEIDRVRSESADALRRHAA